jgi:CheY-specific phosphatase CheX
MSENMAAVLPPEVVRAFNSAAITALQELAQVEASSEWLSPSTDAPMPGPIVAASVRLERPFPGMMTLFLSATSASQLAARYLPEGTVLTDELIDDVAGEFANVIAGQSKTILKGTSYHYTLSTPVVSRAANFEQLPAGANARFAARFDSELGCLLLRIDL